MSIVDSHSFDALRDRINELRSLINADSKEISVEEIISDIDARVFELHAAYNSEVFKNSIAYSLLEKTKVEFQEENKDKHGLEKRLKESEAIVHSIVESLDDIVISCSPDATTPLFISTKASKLFGVSIDELYLNIEIKL